MYFTHCLGGNILRSNKKSTANMEANMKTSVIGFPRVGELRELKFATEKYWRDHLEVFADGFRSMDKAILNADSNGLIAANTRIQECLGWEIQFRNQAEFDSLMDSEDDFKL